MRKKNVIGISFLMALTLMLTGCSVFPTLAGMESKEAKAYANVYDLKANKAYVWHHEGEADIRQDLARDREGENIFFACPKGDTNFKGKELDRSGQYPRSIWINSSMDDEIPTIIGNNALIYISKTTVPKEIVFERFADYGYSIGVSNMIPDEGGHYYFVYAETDKDDYKYYVDTASEAFSLLCFDTVARLYLDKVGGVLVTEENVSDGGTVLGLTKDAQYVCEFYTGTYYQDFVLPANIHSFGSMEQFVSYDYEFLHSNCIKINIPEYFKSGYYFVQGVGLFRYVSEQDAKVYNGEAYDPGIDWNDPIILYDEYGVVVFDPSLGIGMEEETITDENSDAGVSREEVESYLPFEEGSEADEEPDSLDRDRR